MARGSGATAPPRAAATLLGSVFWRRRRRALWEALQTAPKVPALIIVTILMFAAFAEVLAPYAPGLSDFDVRLKPPLFVSDDGARYLMGTDNLGRDVFSRVIHGARISVLVGFLAVGFSGSVGTALGLISGYFGGTLDSVIMRFTDMMLAMPAILLAIALIGVLGASVQNMIIVIAVVTWPAYARIIRAEVLTLRNRDFVQLARVSGASGARIILRHLLPNVVNTLIILATLQIGITIIFEASLSFLGLGVKPPTPAWGFMLSDGQKFLQGGAWWLAILPGIPIVLTVLATNLLGDWLRDRLDPLRRQV